MTATAKRERLTGVAIKRNGEVKTIQRGSHYELRTSLTGDNLPRAGDVEGFYTDANRFVTRREAVGVGVLSGQLHTRWLDGGRDLLSSDVNW